MIDTVPAGPAPRLPIVAPVAGVHARRGADAGARHRRQRRHLLGARRGRPPAAAVPGSRPARGRLEQLDRDAAGGDLSLEYFDYREQLRSFEHFGVSAGDAMTLTGAGEPVRIPLGVVSHGVLPALGVAPQLGRLFTLEEDTPNRNLVVLLGDGLWRRRFGADPGIVGHRVVLDRQPFTVVGVMPPGFRLPRDFDAARPRRGLHPTRVRSHHGADPRLALPDRRGAVEAGRASRTGGYREWPPWPSGSPSRCRRTTRQACTSRPRPHRWRPTSSATFVRCCSRCWARWPSCC